MVNLVIELRDQAVNVFEEIMASLKRTPNVGHLRLNDETVYHFRELIRRFTKRYEVIWLSGMSAVPFGYHIYNLQKKLHCKHSSATFEIENVREIGYCMKINT